jgi:putative membrane protein
MSRSYKDYLIITLKGIAMGAADVVPGVSGGTIAFISGIYEELLETINSFNFKSLKILKNEGFKAMWASLNANFLIALLIGIGISILSLAKIIRWLLENKPVLIWSFFFGLVLASIIYVAKQIKKWNFLTFIMLMIGAVVAYYITILPVTSSNSNSLLYLFLSGSLAICAMILPGISGSFILLLLGVYKPVLDALHDRDIKTISVIILGAIVGLLSFSRLLKWLFQKYHTLTLALLTGFIFGSLNKIWPWKEILASEMINGKLKILQEQNISPFNYQDGPELLWAIFLAVIGFLVIVILEFTANRTNKI